jgi:hypothetical protein
MKYCKHCQEEFAKDSNHWQIRVRKKKDGTLKAPSYNCKKFETEKNLEWRTTNREKWLEIRKQYRVNNNDKIVAYRQATKAQKAEWERNHRHTNIQYRLAGNLRSRLKVALLKNKNENRQWAVRDLGCTIPELMDYLAAKFTEGMTWGNYGEWHIDHVRPLASFDLTDPEAAKLACHYTNLQPLWAVDNLSKAAS